MNVDTATWLQMAAYLSKRGQTVHQDDSIAFLREMVQRDIEGRDTDPLIPVPNPTSGDE